MRRPVAGPAPGFRIDIRMTWSMNVLFNEKMLALGRGVANTRKDPER
jgi:hypothetical protein